LAEADIQNAIRKALSDYGIVVRLNVGVFLTDDGRRIKCGVKGLPDLLFIGNGGKVAFLEVKSLTGKPRPEQIRFIDTLRRMGHIAGICRCVEDALNLIEESGK